jgi:selenium metabolism protein YedF
MKKTIDCRGFACPKPVIMTKKELEAITEGEIEVIVDNQAARENVSRLFKSQGLEPKSEEKEGLYYISAEKKTGCSCEDMNFDTDVRPVILVASEFLGAGDDKLGSMLMKSYMYALTESDVKPKTMLFLNGGVKLTTEGSDSLESIKTLESQGVEIMSCGTCLDFYGLKEKLAVGQVTNMYSIVEKTNGSSNTIRI